MIFDYDILKNPNNITLVMKKFVDHIGDILLELMEKQIKMAQQLLSDRIETTIISNLFFNEDFTRKNFYLYTCLNILVMLIERILFGEIFKFVDGYKNLPTKDTILIELNNRKDLNEDQLKNLRQLVSNASEEEVDLQ